MPQRLIPLTQYARQAGIPENTLRWQIKQGLLPQAQRHGRYWYIAVDGPTPAGLGRIYTLFTHAGGAGKTSLARDLGFELFTRGYRVLLIDADAQANLTAWLGLNPLEVTDQQSLMQVVERRTLPEPQSTPSGLHLIPASMGLALAEVVLPTKPFGSGLLRAALRRSGALEQYDYILVDSPPSLGPIAALAALAGDGLVVPVETSPKGVQAVVSVIKVGQDYLEVLRDQSLAPGLQRFIQMFIPTRHDPRTAQDRRVMQALSEVERVAPVAPALGYRPGPYKQACDEARPVQVVGGAKVQEELSALGDFFVQVTQPKEVVP